MREIKFRCWDVVLKYWLKPDDMPTLMSDEVGEIWEFGGQDDYIFCQWTGLKDKNGVEIYEGDILKHHRYGVTFKVYFSVHSGGWCIERGYKNTTMNLCELCTPHIEVLGNIYENPELLENK